MTNKEIDKNIEILTGQFNEIESLGDKIQAYTKIDTLFWVEVSSLRSKIKNFYTAFATLSKEDKVNHWNKITTANLINLIIE